LDFLVKPQQFPAIPDDEAPKRDPAVYISFVNMIFRKPVPAFRIGPLRDAAARLKRSRRAISVNTLTTGSHVHTAIFRIAGLFDPPGPLSPSEA